MRGELSVATLQTIIKVQQAINEADTTEVLARADAAMYAEKRTRSGTRR